MGCYAARQRFKMNLAQYEMNVTVLNGVRA